MSKKKRRIWEYIPEKDRYIEGLCRRMAIYIPNFTEVKLIKPVFFVGFNNSGKSMILEGLKRQESVVVYPDEGNADLWFDGFYPWMIKQPNVPPIWCDPDKFIQSVLENRKDEFKRSLAQLGAYLWLVGGDNIINDSGMLGALLPDIIDKFKNPRIVHFIRDGRVACYLSARREWSNIMRLPDRYKSAGCEINFNFVLEKMASYWSWTIDRISSMEKSVYKYIEIRYEDICEDYSEQATRIEGLLGIQKGVLKNGMTNKLLNMNSVVLGDMTESQLEIVYRVAGRQLKRLGYLC